MPHFNNNTSPRTNGFIAGTFLVAMLLVVGSVVSETTAPTNVSAADGDNTSGKYAVNTTPKDAGDGFTFNSTPPDGGDVQFGESINLRWATTNATDLIQGGASIWTNESVSVDNSQEQDVNITPTTIGQKTFTLQAENNNNGTQSEVKNINIEVLALTPEIDLFRAIDNSSGSSLNQTANSGNTRAYTIDLADVPFKLDWETTNVHRAESESTPDLSQWSNDPEPDEDGGEQPIGKSTKLTGSNPDLIDLYHEQQRSKSYNFVLTGFNRDPSFGGVSKTVDVTVTDRPTIEKIGFAPGSPENVEIDGEPGSVSTTSVEIEVHKLLNGIVLSVGNIPSELQDKIQFTFEDETLLLPATLSAYPSGLVNLNRSTTLTLEMEGIIYDNENESVDIIATSLNDPPGLSASLELGINVDGFQPRTIEEF